MFSQFTNNQPGISLKLTRKFSIRRAAYAYRDNLDFESSSIALTRWEKFKQ